MRDDQGSSDTIPAVEMINRLECRPSPPARLRHGGDPVKRFSIAFAPLRSPAELHVMPMVVISFGRRDARLDALIGSTTALSGIVPDGSADHGSACVEDHDAATVVSSGRRRLRRSGWPTAAEHDEAAHGELRSVRPNRRPESVTRSLMRAV